MPDDDLFNSLEERLRDDARGLLGETPPTPLIAELPAPADPAGGVSCAKACPGTIRLPSVKARTSAELRNIQVAPGAVASTKMWGVGSRTQGSPVFSRHRGSIP